jgi:hypothetical protein
MSTRREITVYPSTGEKFVAFRQVDGVTEVLDKNALKPGAVCDESQFNYHERINRTYYELECAGKLNDMSPRQKERIRDVHRHAQNPAYWPDGE